MPIKKSQVGIIMGSDSDLKVMIEASKILSSLGISSEISVISAHRTPERAAQYSNTAIKRGLRVIIAGAGGAAHLAGVIASFTTLPVIGVPISSKLHGLDSLLATVQMPSGVPVATVAIDGAKNAGLLAAQIIALQDKNIAKKVADFKKSLAREVEKKSQKLASMSPEKYLDEMA